MKEIKIKRSEQCINVAEITNDRLFISIHALIWNIKEINRFLLVLKTINLLFTESLILDDIVLTFIKQFQNIIIYVKKHLQGLRQKEKRNTKELIVEARATRKKR